MSNKEAVRIFKVLSVESRIEIIELLKKKSLCVNALSELLGITAAAVSQHLRILRDADIVIADKRGYYVHYTVNHATLTEWQKIADGLLSVNE